MIKTKLNIVTALFLIAILINVSFVNSFASVNFDVIEDENIVSVEEEKKQLCPATLDDDFADDSVVVIFNNDTSLKLNKFDENDFGELKVKKVKDITERKIDLIKNEYASKIQEISSYPTKEKSKLSATGSNFDNYYIDEDLKKEHSNFHQMVVLKLENKGKQQVLDAVHKLEERDDVLAAEPNYTAHIDAVPSDTFIDEQWAVNKIDLPSAWDITTGSKTVNVGVIDTGIKLQHSDLTANIDTSLSKSFLDNDPFTDIKGHGTHVAGIIGAVGNNNRGIAGACWNINLISLKIYAKDANGDDIGGATELAEALFYAEENNIEIVNNSNSFTKNPVCLKEAVDNYSGILITSAGNRLTDIDANTIYSQRYPSKFTNDNIVVVAASNEKDGIWIDYNDASGGSNYGIKSVDIAAPGQHIYSTYIGDTSDKYYASMTGTSMATPYVAGVAALIKSKYPGISTSGIKKALLDSVDKIPDWSDKVKSGGRLNAYKALRAVENCKYTIVYDKNGGSGNNMSNTTVTYGINTRLRKNTYLPPKGKKFDGWNAYRASDKKWYYTNGTNSGWYLEGSQPSGYKKHLYSDEVNVAHTTSVSNDTIIMYAQWSYINYTVTFNSNGGTGSTMTPQQITYGTYQKLRKNTYTRNGYIFYGWNGYRKSDNKWYYDNGTDDCWCLEGNEPNGYQKHIYTDEVTVGKSTTVHNDTVIMYANWLRIGDVDLDGTLDINDVTLIQKYVAHIVTFTDTQRLVADVNGDGKISIEDATALQDLI